jgi:hypothetical protein
LPVVKNDCARSRGHSLLVIRFNERGTVFRARRVQGSTSSWKLFSCPSFSL